MHPLLAALVAVLLFLFPAALAQQQRGQTPSTPTVGQTSPIPAVAPPTPLAPQTPIKTMNMTVGWLDVVRDMHLPHNLWSCFWNLFGSSIALLINSGCDLTSVWGAVSGTCGPILNAIYTTCLAPISGILSAAVSIVISLGSGLIAGIGAMLTGGIPAACSLILGLCTNTVVGLPAACLALCSGIAATLGSLPGVLSLFGLFGVCFGGFFFVPITILFLLTGTAISCLGAMCGVPTSVIVGAVSAGISGCWAAIMGGIGACGSIPGLASCSSSFLLGANAVLTWLGEVIFAIAGVGGGVVSGAVVGAAGGGISGSVAGAIALVGGLIGGAIGSVMAMIVGVFSSLCSAVCSVPISILTSACAWLLSSIGSCAACVISPVASIITLFINLAMSGLNFMATAGTLGVALVGVIISILNVIGTALSFGLIAVLTVGEVVLGIANLCSFTLFSCIPLLISAVISPALSVASLVAKLQQMAIVLLSQPFGFCSLITILSAPTEVFVACIPTIISWLGLCSYPLTACSSLCSFVPGVGIAVSAVLLAISVFALFFFGGALLALLISLAGFLLFIIVEAYLLALMLFFALTIIGIPLAILLLLIVILVIILTAAGGVVVPSTIFLLGLICAAIFPLLILIVGAILIIPSIIIFPLIGCLTCAVIVPLAESLCVFGSSSLTSVLDTCAIGAEQLFSLCTLALNFCGLTAVSAVLQIAGMSFISAFLDCVQLAVVTPIQVVCFGGTALGISEAVSVITIFFDRLAKMVPFAAVILYPLEALAGIAMLAYACVLFACTILCYPLNFVWQYVQKALSWCYGICCKPFIRPLGWS